MSDSSLAVLIHGCHLQANLSGKPWEDIVWAPDENGVPTLAGRAVMGLKFARDNNADLVVFSTGASERDGMKEGEYTFDRASRLADKLYSLLGFDSKDACIDWMVGVSELDLESQNTREECERNFRLCAERGIKRVVLVSSPWHIERSHAEALAVADTMRTAGEAVPEIMAVASHGGTEGIVILEPPHRGDRPRTRWHELARRFFKVPEARLLAFEQELGELFSEYEA